MRVLLRHSGIGLYYAGRKHWVSNQAAAKHLETIKQAIELSGDESFEEMEVFVIYDEPDCELVLPLRRKKAWPAERLLAAA